MGFDEAGEPPTKRVVTSCRLKGPEADSQQWRITTAGSPLNRIAGIFSRRAAGLNTVTHEFGFPAGTSLIRPWQILDVGSGLAVLRNFGRCLTRLSPIPRPI